MATMRREWVPYLTLISTDYRGVTPIKVKPGGSGGVCGRGTHGKKITLLQPTKDPLQGLCKARVKKPI